MRKLGLIAATAVASVSVVAVAQAIDVNQGLEVKTTGKKGTKAKPSGIKLNVTTTTSAKDESLNGEYATKSAVIHFDKNLKFNSSKFPKCALAVVASKPENCPTGSLVGKGEASAIAGPGQEVKVNPSIEAYNSAGGKLQLKLIAKPGEFDSQGILTGTIKNDTGKYGKKLVVPIPAKLQNNLGLFVTLTRFNTVISNKKYKGINYVESVGCGTSGKYNFGGDFVFTDDSTAKVKTTSKC